MDGEPSLLGVEPQLISAPSRAPQQTSAAAVFRELKTAFETHETAVIAILVGHAQPDGTLNEVKWAATERDFFEDTRSSWWARIFAQADLQRLTTSDDGNSASLPVVMGGAFETWELHFTKASDGRWYLLKHAP